jgi:hypothetical protein
MGEKRRRFSRKFLLVTVVLVLALAGGIAVAQWLVTGTGSGFAQAGTAGELGTVDLPATDGFTGDDLLVPGASGDFVITISNPNTFPVNVTDITGEGAITSDKGAACDASTGVTFTNQTGLSLLVPAGGQETFILEDAVQMDNTSANECQGARFTIPVTLAGVSAADGDDGDCDGDGGEPPPPPPPPPAP